MVICVFCHQLECQCDWRVRERRRVFQAELDGNPIRTVNYVCNHFAGHFPPDASKAHNLGRPITVRQREAIDLFHKTHTLKRRPDFPAQ